MADHRHHEAHPSIEDQYLETPAGAEYEHTDANIWMIVKFGLWLALAAAIVHVGLGFMYSTLITQAEKTGPAQYPLASATPALPPAPRLQQFPRNEIYEFRLGEQRQLNSYGWVNKDAGTVHIPISEAMRELVQRGMPTQVDTNAAGAGEGPEMLASDASSGRVMERRRE